jgi:hypothetical protein
VRTLTVDGWWLGVKYAYRLSHVSFSGDTIRTVELAREAERLPEAARDSAERQEREVRRRVTRGEYDVETTLQPIFEELAVDDRDHVWVMLSARPGEQHTRFDVFDVIGRYLGQVEVPHLADPRVVPVIRGGTMYLIAKDELDVPYVVVLDVGERRGRAQSRRSVDTTDGRS